jgi:hypothetical protein
MDLQSTDAQQRVSARERRRQLAPHITDAEEGPIIPFPYVMYLPLSRYATPTANADELGFRVSIKYGQRLKLNKVKAVNVKKGIVLGNGQLWGTGASSDSKVMHNVLNDLRPDEVWYSLALRASNMTQERIAAELFAPLDTASAVWVSGSRLLGAALSTLSHRKFLPCPGFERYLAAFGMSDTEATEPFNLESRWHELLALFEREIALFGRVFGHASANAIFALQPTLGWSDKPLSPQERELADLFKAEAGPGAIDPEAFKAFAKSFTLSAEKICTRHNVKFVNVAEAPEFMTRDWLFLDGAHMTDAGHDALARVITRAL